jgi:hypothetical protein
LIMLVRGNVTEPQLRKAGDHDDRQHANECPMGVLDGDRSACCATGIVAEVISGDVRLVTDGRAAGTLMFEPGSPR